MNTINVNEISECRKCGKNTYINNIETKDNKVIYGVYTCDCGYENKCIVGWIDIVEEKEMLRKSIGELQIILNGMSKDKMVRTNIPGSEYVEKDYGSDRGNYSDLYIELSSKDKGIDVSALLGILNEALKDSYMVGYKGGEYDISEETLVTLGSYGYSGRYIISVEEKEDSVVLIADL